MASIKQLDEKLKEAQRQQLRFEQELNQAKQSGVTAAISAASKKFQNARNNVNTAKRNKEKAIKDQLKRDSRR